MQLVTIGCAKLDSKQQIITREFFYLNDSFVYSFRLSQPKPKVKKGDDVNALLMEGLSVKTKKK